MSCAVSSDSRRVAASATTGASAWMEARGNSEQRSPIPKRRIGCVLITVSPVVAPATCPVDLYGVGLHGVCQGWNGAKNRVFAGEIARLRRGVGVVRLSARERRTATGHSRTLFAGEPVYLVGRSQAIVRGVIRRQWHERNVRLQTCIDGRATV